LPPPGDRCEPIRSRNKDMRFKLWVLVKRVLRKHGYPPDKQQNATQTVLAQVELLLSESSEQ
jgi:type I restriction enzyme R subunit